MDKFKFDKPIKVSIEIEDDENEDYNTAPFLESAQSSYTHSKVLEEPTDFPLQKAAKTSFTRSVLEESNNGYLKTASHTAYTNSNVPCQQHEVPLQKHKQIPYTDNNFVEQNNLHIGNYVRGVQNSLLLQRTTETPTIRTDNTPKNQKQSSLNNLELSFNVTNSQISNRFKGAPVTDSKNDFVDTDRNRALNKLQLIFLLDRLSEKLIILYQYGFNASNNFKYDHNLQFEATQLYFKVKEKIFSSSYITVAAIILPQEHNENFIQKFIKRTIAIAHMKKWYYISEVVLHNRIKELIDWTKMRGKQMSPETNAVPLVKWSVVSQPNTNMNVMPKNVEPSDNKVVNRLNGTEPPRKKRKYRKRKASLIAQNIQTSSENQSELKKLLIAYNPAPNRIMTVGSVTEPQEQVIMSHFFSNNKNTSENESSAGENHTSIIKCRQLRLSRDSGIESPARSNEPITETEINWPHHKYA